MTPLDKAGGRKYIVTILTLAILVGSGWVKGIDTTSVVIVALAYIGGNAGIQVASTLVSNKTTRRKA